MKLKKIYRLSKRTALKSEFVEGFIVNIRIS